MSNLQRRKSASSARLSRQGQHLGEIYSNQNLMRGLSGMTNFLSAGVNLASTLAPNVEAWKQYEEGREAVGMERTDEELSFFDKIGRAFKGPDLKEKSQVWSSGEEKGWESGHEYSTAELKRIGMETMAGTAATTLEGSQWKDLLGKNVGQRFAEPEKSITQGSTTTQTYKSAFGINKDMTLGKPLASDWQKFNKSSPEILGENNRAGLRGGFGMKKMGMSPQGMSDNMKQELQSMSEPSRPYIPPDDPMMNEDYSYGSDAYFEDSTLPERTEQIVNKQMEGQDYDMPAIMDADEFTEWEQPPPPPTVDFSSLPAWEKVGMYVAGENKWDEMRNKARDVENAPSLGMDWNRLGRKVTGSNLITNPWKMPWEEE